MLSAADQVSLVEGRPLPLAKPVFRDGTRLRPPWLRRGAHGYVPGFSSHLVNSYYGRSADCTWVVENKRLRGPLRPGSISVIPEHYDGHWHFPGPAEVAHVYLPDQRLQSCAALLPGGHRIELIPRIGCEDRVAATLLKLLFEAPDLQDSSATLFAEQVLDLVCLQLIRVHSAPAARTDTIPKGGLTRRQLRLVTSYMLERIDEEITLIELAGLLNLSRFHFCRAFRNTTGLAPHAWLTRQRMQRARALIANSNLPIASIAVAVGFTTPSAFAAAFRKAFGKSPTQLRRYS
jgi:AraC family transcriptional regulator